MELILGTTRDTSATSLLHCLSPRSCTKSGLAALSQHWLRALDPAASLRRFPHPKVIYSERWLFLFFKKKEREPRGERRVRFFWQYRGAGETPATQANWQQPVTLPLPAGRRRREELRPFKSPPAAGAEPPPPSRGWFVAPCEEVKRFARKGRSVRPRAAAPRRRLITTLGD